MKIYLIPVNPNGLQSPMGGYVPQDHLTIDVRGIVEG